MFRYILSSKNTCITIVLFLNVNVPILFSDSLIPLTVTILIEIKSYPIVDLFVGFGVLRENVIALASLELRILQSEGL